MNKPGRPKKKGAKKAGELTGGLCRFSFIADKKIVAAIKDIARGRGQSIKDLMMDYLYTIPTDDEKIMMNIKKWKAEKKRTDKISEKYLRSIK